MGEVVPGVEEALALDPRSGVRRVKRRLTIRLNRVGSIKQMFILLMTTTDVRVGAVERPDREVGRLLAESRGTYCHLLGGWLVGFQYCQRTHDHAHNFSWDTKLWS